MDLARLALAMRPRGPWEGIDLGFAMARRWFLPLWRLWWVVALPFALVTALLFPDRPWLAIVLLWWGKPLYEPLLLFWLSRALFGQRPGLGQSLRQWRAILQAQPLAYLTWRRFSPSRSLYMPVGLLERLRGAQRRTRVEVLGRGQQGGFWLTLVAFHFEMLLQIALLVLLVLALPEELQWLDWELLFFEPGPFELWLQIGVDLLGMSLIAPFYVSAGFALYLTRRSELEAWDIEIGFRRLRERRASRAAAWLLPLLGLGLAGLPAPPAAATEPNPEQARALIAEVLAQPDFGRSETSGYWKYIGEEEVDDATGGSGFWDWLEGFEQGLAEVGELLLWFGAGILLGYLFYRSASAGGWLRRREPPLPASAQAPATLFGLELEGDRLPADPVAEARRLLAAERPREALSLLYRGSLAALLARRLEIPGSATEGECLALVAAQRPAPEVALFRRLTAAWISLAYGHQIPGREPLEALCREWPAVFGGRHGD